MKFTSKPEYKQFFTRLIEVYGCDDYSLLDFLTVPRRMPGEHGFSSYVERLLTGTVTPDEVIAAANRANPK
jgi:hypothetical protein